MAKIDTLFMTKTAEKPYLLGPHIPIRPYKGAPPGNVSPNYISHTTRCTKALTENGNLLRSCMINRFSH